MNDNNQNHKTIIKPRPGGRPVSRVRRAGQQRPAPAPQVIQPTPAVQAKAVFKPAPALPVTEGQKNNLVILATPLLTLASSLRNSVSHPDAEALRVRLGQSITDFTQQLLQLGYLQDTVEQASYALCTLIDEMVLNTPWGGHSSWGTQTLLSQFHGEAWGGENFFTRLESLKIQPAINLDVLELYYLCLSLGLQGRFRVLDNGQGQVNDVREDLYQLIHRQKGGYEKALSPHWQGVQNLENTLIQYIPWWAILVVTSGLLLGIYLVFLYLINNAANRQAVDLDKVAREKNPLYNEFITLVEYVPEYVEPAEKIQLEKRKLSLKELLAPEIKQGLIDVFDREGRVVIRTRGLFISGSDKVMPKMIPLINRIAEELNDMKGKILVSGHTDNVPIFSVKFPSNWVLSEARANQVMHMLKQNMNPDIKFVSEGRADQEPVADNKTSAHRALNRRVEIIVSERI